MNPRECVVISAINGDGETLKSIQSELAQRLPGDDGSTDGKKFGGL